MPMVMCIIYPDFYFWRSFCQIYVLAVSKTILTFLGGNLYEKIMRQKELFHEETIIWYFFQLASAVDHIHDYGILHRCVLLVHVYCIDAMCLDNKQYFDQFKTTLMHVTYPCRMTNTGCGTGWSTKPRYHDPQSSLIKLVIDVIDVGGCWDLIWFHLPARVLIPLQ